jgi:MerR family transcriptional regulator, light-induced transcriptional regulator
MFCTMNHDTASRAPFRIAEVVRLTGVGLHTLRAWERRYGVPVPARTEGRQRMYSLRDVEMVKQMRSLSQRGVPLALAAGQAKREVDEPQPNAAVRLPMSARLTAALLDLDEPAAAREWHVVLEVMDALSAFERVVIPAMRDIGQAWHDGNVNVAQEHFATHFFRSRIDMLGRQTLPAPGAPVALLACVAGEHHELGLLMLAVMLRFNGFRTIYLGQDVPTNALVRSVEDLQPQVLALNAGTPEGARLVEPIVRTLAETAPLTGIVYGGGAFDAEPSLRPGKPALYGGQSLTEAVTLITQLGRRTPAGGTP